MLLWAVIAAVAFSAIFLFQIRAYKATGRKPDISYFFYRNSLEFLLPFLAVVLAYGLLLLFVSVFSETLSLRSLVRLEQGLEKAKNAFSPLRLTPFRVMILLLVIYVLGLLGLPAERSARWREAFSKYRTVARRTYVFLVLLCSFTLFGLAPGDPSSRLQLRIKSLREGYAVLKEEAREVLADRAAPGLFAKAVESSPPSYQKALLATAEVEKQSTLLRERYAWAKTELDIREPKVERILPAAPETIQGTAQAVPRETVKKPAPEDVPGEVSERSLRAAREALWTPGRPFGERLGALLKAPGAKDVLLQIPKIWTRQVKRAMVQGLVERLPVLEPVFDSLVKTADDAFEKRLASRADRVTEALLKDASSGARTLETEAAGLVAETSIAATPEIQQRAERQAREVEGRLAAVHTAAAGLETSIRRAEERRIERLIAGLESPNEEVRTAAVNQLVERGESLSRAQIGRLVELARHGEEGWSTHLSREGHCDWYEKTKVKYYAGNALAQIKNPHVTDAVLREAENARNDGQERYKVTDPGWI